MSLKTTKTFITLFIIVFLSFCIYGIEHALLSNGYILLKVMFAVLLSLMTWFGCKYLSSETLKNENKGGWFDEKRNYLIIIIAVLITYFPFITDGYFFNDDYWFFTGDSKNDCGLSIALMRPFHSILGSLFWFVTPSLGFIIKWMSIVFTIFYGLILYKWIYKKCGNSNESLLLALALILFSPISDHIGYSSTLSFMPGMVAAGLSVVQFETAFEQYHKKDYIISVGYVILSILCLLFSFMLYQISTPIVFLFLVIFVYFNKTKNSLLFCFSYLLYFALIASMYYMVNKIIINFYNAGVWSRGSLISIEEVPDKILWYFNVILPASLDRLSAAFLGRIVIANKCYWHFIGYFNPLLRNIIIGVLIFLISASMIGFFVRKKSIIDSLLLIIFIPMTYFCFLIIKENGYLTYYAIPLISILLFFIIILPKEIYAYTVRCRNYSNINNHTWLVPTIILILALAFQNNLYIRQFWVGTNMENYNYLKNTISLHVNEKKEIHVFGVLTPGQGNIYSLFAAKLALKELGYNPADFKITVSDNDNLISVLQTGIVEEMKKSISHDELQFLMSNYIYDSTYNRYLYNAGKLDEYNSNLLKDIFIKTKLLPGNYNNTIVVDLRWITPMWKNIWQ